MRMFRTPKGKKYCCTGHAVRRMVQRNIRQTVLEDALDTYDDSDYDSEGNERLFRDLPDGRRLRVIVARDSDPLRVITIIII